MYAIPVSQCGDQCSMISICYHFYVHHSHLIDILCFFSREMTDNIKNVLRKLFQIEKRVKVKLSLKKLMSVGRRPTII
jgi:hypothetical protein